MKGLELANKDSLCKFIITSDCIRKCPYCLSKNLHIKESSDILKCAKQLDKLCEDYGGIMLTGGEPTVAKWFKEKLFLSKAFFDFVAITTGQPDFLKSSFARLLNEIVLSLHCGILNTPKVPQGMTVYAAILDFQFDCSVPERLFNLGYKGLTIAENKFGKEIFDESLIKDYDSFEQQFSIKINRRDYCVQDRYFLMPDLEIISDYSKYLSE